jgi:hypothetical protein
MNSSKWKMLGMAAFVGVAVGVSTGLTAKRGGKWAKPVPFGVTMGALVGVISYFLSSSAYYSGALDGLDKAVGPPPGMSVARLGAYIPEPQVVTFDNTVLRRYS